MYTRAIIVVVFSVGIKVDAVPPDACFENFKWDNCGEPPVRVLYYWKPGSRCEVGIWRGCLPNMNMFKDEYECISTCIFTARAEPRDYHELSHDDETAATTDIYNITDIGSTTGANTGSTTVTDVGIHNATVAAAVNTTDSKVNSTST